MKQEVLSYATNCEALQPEALPAEDHKPKFLAQTIGRFRPVVFSRFKRHKGLVARLSHAAMAGLTLEVPMNCFDSTTAEPSPH